MENSLGGHKHSSAYCLVYVLEERIIKENSISLPIRLYQISEESKANDFYTTIVPKELSEKINNENL